MTIDHDTAAMIRGIRGHADALLDGVTKRTATDHHRAIGDYLNQIAITLAVQEQRIQEQRRTIEHLKSYAQAIIQAD